jgi:hypothetical protein
MAASSTSCEAIWLFELIVKLIDQMLEPTIVYCDNQCCIRLFEYPVLHDCPKHIDIRYHFLRDGVKIGVVVLEYVLLDLQVADILTKPLAKGKFEMSRERLGLVENIFLAKR